MEIIVGIIQPHITITPNATPEVLLRSIGLTKKLPLCTNQKVSFINPAYQIMIHGKYTFFGHQLRLLCKLICTSNISQLQYGYHQNAPLIHGNEHNRPNLYLVRAVLWVLY